MPNPNLESRMHFVPYTDTKHDSFCRFLADLLTFCGLCILNFITCMKKAHIIAFLRVKKF